MSDAKEEVKGSPVLHGFHHQGATPAPEFVKQSEVKTVTMLFPKPVTLLLDNHQRIEFKAGPQEVPIELVSPKLHFYLEHNNVKPYVPAPPVVQGVAEVKVTEHHVAFLNSHGYSVQDVEAASRFIGNLSPVEKVGFFAQAEAWTPEQKTGVEDTDLDEQDDQKEQDEVEGDAAEEGETDAAKIETADAVPAEAASVEANAASTGTGIRRPTPRRRRG